MKTNLDICAWDGTAAVVCICINVWMVVRSAWVVCAWMCLKIEICALLVIVPKCRFRKALSVWHLTSIESRNCFCCCQPCWSESEDPGKCCFLRAMPHTVWTHWMTHWTTQHWRPHPYYCVPGRWWRHQWHVGKKGAMVPTHLRY